MTMAMDWNAMAAWLYENDTPDYAKLAAHKIGTVYVDPRSANCDALLVDLQAHGVRPGVYVALSWYSGLTGSQFAQTVSAILGRWRTFAYPVMVDIEPTTTAFVSDFLSVWRTLRPTRDTSLTFASGQDQTVYPIAAMQNANLHLYIQLYNGDMSPEKASTLWPSFAQLIKAGYPLSMIHPFYDGADVPWNATDGAVFTAERLGA